MTLRIGWDALRDYDKKQRQTADISHLLSAKSDEIVEAVQRMTEQNDAYQAQVIALHDEIFRLRAQALPKGAPKLWQFAEGLTPVETRRFADALAGQAEWAAVFTDAGENHWQYAVCSHTQDVRAICQALNTTFHGYGGGKPAVVQGAIHATRAQIEAFCEEYRL